MPNSAPLSWGTRTPPALLQHFAFWSQKTHEENQGNDSNFPETPSELPRWLSCVTCSYDMIHPRAAFSLPVNIVRERGLQQAVHAAGRNPGCALEIKKALELFSCWGPAHSKELPLQFQTRSRGGASSFLFSKPYSGPKEGLYLHNLDFFLSPSHDFWKLRYLKRLAQCWVPH